MNNELNTNPFDKPDLNELAHYGVKGMKWGVIRSRRIENRTARNKTKTALRDIRDRPAAKDDESILRARKQLPKAQQKLYDAKDAYKVNKRSMNKIDAKRPSKIAAAELSRIATTANTLTKSEQQTFNSMKLGNDVIDAIFGDKKDPVAQYLADKELKQKIIADSARRSRRS